MVKILFFLFVLHAFSLASPMPANAENQTWKVRPGDSLDVIATTLEIPKEEIKKHNPRILEGNLLIGQKLKLPLRSYVESKMLEEELGKKDAALKEEVSKKDAAIGRLERANSDFEKQVTIAESQLRWHSLWFWGFWISFGLIAFIVAGACWIFRQTHPRVFDRPRERSVRDLKESQIRLRSTFPHEEEGASSREGGWHPAAGQPRLDLNGQARQLSRPRPHGPGWRNGLVTAREPVC